MTYNIIRANRKGLQMMQIILKTFGTNIDLFVRFVLFLYMYEI